MPGAFAVFALVLTNNAYVMLALDYLRLCDGEHQSAHASLLHAYLGQHGFTSDAIRLLIATAENIQDISAHRSYPALIANHDSLASLVQIQKNRLSETFVDQSTSSTLWGSNPDRAWQNLLTAIWGKTAVDNPEKIVKAAPKSLQSLYRSVLFKEG